MTVLLIMGEVISPTAKPERIGNDVTESYQNGLARGGDIAEAAKNRLELPLQAIENASVMLQSASKAASAAWILVLAADNNADNVIGSVRDEMYNALGRPRQSPAMGEVFPGGIGTYTSGDPGVSRSSCKCCMPAFSPRPQRYGPNPNELHGPPPLRLLGSPSMML